MSRHALPDDRSFERSLAVAVGRALLVLAMVGGLTWGASRVGGEAREGSATPAPTPATSPDPLAALATVSPRATVEIAPSAPAPPTDPDEAPTVDPVATPSVADPSEDPDEEPSGVVPPAEDTTVQVLDGLGDPERLEEVAETLRGLGYDVVAVNSTRRPAQETTVLYSEGAQVQAQALQAADPRFAEVDANDRYTPTVDLHVLVGANWPE